MYVPIAYLDKSILAGYSKNQITKNNRLHCREVLG